MEAGIPWSELVNQTSGDVPQARLDTLPSGRPPRADYRSRWNFGPEEGRKQHQHFLFWSCGYFRKRRAPWAESTGSGCLNHWFSPGLSLVQRRKKVGIYGDQCQPLQRLEVVSVFQNQIIPNTRLVRCQATPAGTGEEGGATRSAEATPTAALALSLHDSPAFSCPPPPPAPAPALPLESRLLDTPS